LEREVEELAGTSRRSTGSAYSKGESLHESDGFVPALAMEAMTPDQVGTSASQRPSPSRSISTANVRLAGYYFVPAV
jgi:hypothetical protein